jgi:predicted aldo/keto reductase-like oxidoreductase
VGFNGHKHPAIHLEMLNRGYAFDVVQMPLNPLDPGFGSFENSILPVVNQRGVAVLRMKSMGGSGELMSKGAFTPSEALSYAMSLPVATTISGIDSMEVLDQNLAILRDFQPLSADQMQTLRDHGKQFNDGRYELYKSTLKYNSDLGPREHGYPSDAELPL